MISLNSNKAHGRDKISIQMLKICADTICKPLELIFKQALATSCINHLLSITHEIYSSVDDGFEVRGIFLDISKVFDNLWHEGIIFKLKQNGISDDLLNILSDFLRNRKQ